MVVFVPEGGSRAPHRSRVHSKKASWPSFTAAVKNSMLIADLRFESIHKLSVIVFLISGFWFFGSNYVNTQGYCCIMIYLDSTTRSIVLYYCSTLRYTGVLRSILRSTKYTRRILNHERVAGCPLLALSPGESTRLGPERTFLEVVPLRTFFPHVLGRLDQKTKRILFFLKRKGHK